MVKTLGYFNSNFEEWQDVYSQTHLFNTKDYRSLALPLKTLCTQPRMHVPQTATSGWMGTGLASVYCFSSFFVSAKVLLFPFFLIYLQKE